MALNTSFNPRNTTVDNTRYPASTVKRAHDRARSTLSAAPIVTNKSESYENPMSSIQQFSKYSKNFSCCCAMQISERHHSKNFTTYGTTHHFHHVFCIGVLRPFHDDHTHGRRRKPARFSLPHGIPISTYTSILHNKTSRRFVACGRPNSPIEVLVVVMYVRGDVR